MTSALQTTRKRNGSRAEDLLDVYHKICEIKRVAKIDRVSTPMRIIGHEHGVFRAVFSGKQGPDYRGYMLDGSARFVMIECKSLDREDAPFPLSMLTDHQVQCLDDCHEAKGLSLVAIVRGPMRVLSVINWDYITQCMAHGKRSIATEVLDRVKVKHGEAYLERWKR